LIAAPRGRPTPAAGRVARTTPRSFPPGRLSTAPTRTPAAARILRVHSSMPWLRTSSSNSSQDISTQTQGALAKRLSTASNGQPMPGIPRGPVQNPYR
jgi:hypothetical protein